MLLRGSIAWTPVIEHVAPLTTAVETRNLSDLQRMGQFRNVAVQYSLTPIKQRYLTAEQMSELISRVHTGGIPED
jgi:hypothetical protein